MRRKIEGDVVALRKFAQYKLFEPNGQSRNLNAYSIIYHVAQNDNHLLNLKYIVWSGGSTGEHTLKSVWTDQSLKTNTFMIFESCPPKYTERIARYVGLWKVSELMTE